MTNETAFNTIVTILSVNLGSVKLNSDVRQALMVAVSAIEKQIPKKPYIDNENGVYEKEYCPTCRRSLFPNDHHCRCGQRINWSDEQ